MSIFKPEWDLPAKIKACYTTRAGGVSASPFDTLNVADHVNDNPRRVNQNRNIVMSSQALASSPCWLEQTHSTTVVTLESEANRQADAAITREPGKIAAIMTADCLPILLCNQSGTEVAAVHAGWRGLLHGVIQQTILAMQSNASTLQAWIGPAITQAYFEVGDEVRTVFNHHYDFAHQRFIFNREHDQSKHWLCDLPGLAEDILNSMGVANVTQSNLCSYSNHDFFSYRRNEITGRMASLIWIDNDA